MHANVTFKGRVHGQWSAFLKGAPLEELVYMKAPPGGNCNPLYGLKAPHAWKRRLHVELKMWKMVSGDTDCEVYIKQGRDGLVAQATSVDDFRTAGFDCDMDSIEESLIEQFNVQRTTMEPTPSPSTSRGAQRTFWGSSAWQMRSRWHARP
jgi:hypothetical protein